MWRIVTCVKFQGVKKEDKFLGVINKKSWCEIFRQGSFCLVCCFRFTKLPKFPKSLSQANFCCLHSQICGGNTILGNKSLFCPKFLQLQLEPQKSGVFFQRYVSSRPAFEFAYSGIEQHIRKVPSHSPPHFKFW